MQLANTSQQDSAELLIGDGVPQGRLLDAQSSGSAHGRKKSSVFSLKKQKPKAEPADELQQMVANAKTVDKPI
jgi:hypothetical protein